MSQVLKTYFAAASFVLLSALNHCSYGQCVVKTMLKNNVKTTRVADYYTYNRVADSYDGLAINIAYVAPAGSKTSCKMNLIYTSSSSKIAQKIIFMAGDSAKQIDLTLTNGGIKHIDNKKLHSNIYQTAIPVPQQLFFTQTTINRLLILDAKGQTLAAFTITDPSFLQQQFTCLQSITNPQPQPQKSNQNR